MRKITGIIVLMLLTALCLPANNALCQNYNDTTIVVDTLESDTTYVSPPLEEDEEYDEETTESGEEIVPILRQVSNDSIMSIKKDKGFAYMSYLDSMLRAEQEARKRKPVEQERVDYSPSFWNSDIVKILFWGIAIAVVVFVLFKLFKGDGGIFTTNKSLELPKVATDDEVPENDLEGLLQRSIRNGNYRLATRYQFLKTIGRLGERGILKLSTDKTNYQYASEIHGKPYANSFARLCLQYEYVWFGEFAVNQQQFETIQKEHQQFLKEI
ncbi:MAG: hypothetical protein V4722_03795 [Bacteroidota bacterium]